MLKKNNLNPKSKWKSTYSRIKTLASSMCKKWRMKIIVIFNKFDYKCYYASIIIIKTLIYGTNIFFPFKLLVRSAFCLPIFFNADFFCSKWTKNEKKKNSKESSPLSWCLLTLLLFVKYERKYNSKLIHLPESIIL